MEVEIIGVFIPIIFIVIVGLIVITGIYLKSRERQMLIEKGLTAEDMKAFFENKKSINPFLLARIGIICIFFGLGLGLGMFMEDVTSKEYWAPLCIFVGTGLGFVLANFFGSKFPKVS